MEKEIELFYDHYKDSFEHLQKFLKSRDWYMVFSLGIIAVLLFQYNNYESINQIAKELLEGKAGIKTQIQYPYINSILLFSLLSVILKYYQSNIFIDRQYDYISSIEKSLSESLSKFDIEREGVGYAANYPWVLNIIHYIYTVVFPVSLLAVMLLSFSSNKLINFTANKGFFYFNTIIIALIIIVTIFYMIRIHFNDFKKKTTTNEKE